MERDVAERHPEPGLRVRVVEQADLPELMALVRDCPEAPAWPEEAWRSFLMEGELDAAVHRTLFASLAPGRGFSGLIAVMLLGDTTELELLLVHPKRRREGIGGGLLMHWLQWAQAAEAKEALLEVRASNTRAQALYRRSGFEDQGWRRRYYHHPSEDALLMRLGLAPGTANRTSANS